MTLRGERKAFVALLKRDSNTIDSVTVFRVVRRIGYRDEMPRTHGNPLVGFLVIIFQCFTFQERHH